MKLYNIGGTEFQLKVISKKVISLYPKNENSNIAQFAECIQQSKSNRIVDVIGTNSNVTINYKGKREKILRHLQQLSFKMPESVVWTIPVCFEGFEDWRRIENELGINKADYIKKLLKCEINISMFGFIPGFIYCNGLDKKLQVTRKAKPVRNTMPNVLAVGGPYIGIYSLPSPAGWNIIGKIPADLFDINKATPTKLKIGDRIKLNEISLDDYSEMKKAEIS